MKKYIVKALLLNIFVASFCVAQESSRPVFIKQNELFCSSNPSSVFCSKEEAVPPAVGNKDLFIKQLILANRTIKDRFFTVRDVDDVWTSFGERFIRDRSFIMKGDCEDLTMTTIEYAIHLGIPKNRLARAIVISYPLSIEGNFSRIEVHMVAVYHSLETNIFYYFGDTLSNGIVVTTASTHEPVFIDWITDNYAWLVADQIERSPFVKELQSSEKNNK
jgi:hypothetical protein